MKSDRIGLDWIRSDQIGLDGSNRNEKELNEK